MAVNVVSVPSVKLNVNSVLMERYPLVGSGEVSNSYCGHFAGFLGCDRVDLHELIGKKIGKDFANKFFSRKVFFSCGKPVCPACYRLSWVPKQAGKCLDRLDAGVGLLNVSSSDSVKIEHVVVSLSPERHFGIEDERVLRKIAMKALKELGFIGGVLIFHGSRHRDYEQIEGGVFRQFATDWSPHYHAVGFFQGGYACRGCAHKSSCIEGCSGFDAKRWVYRRKTGIYCKVLGERKTVFGTLKYQLNHASLTKGSKRFHVVTYLGVIGYRKVKVKPVNKSICGICEHELHAFSYVGERSFVTDRDAEGYERDTLEDYREDGQIFWVELPRSWFSHDFVGGKPAGEKPLFGSMEWLKRAKRRSVISWADLHG